MDKRKTLGVVTASTLTAIGLMVSTLAFSNTYRTSTRLKASDYSLTLNSSNGISESGNSTKNIKTDSGAYEVEFGYTNCAPLNGGHAIINAGGKIVNNDHIRSIYSLVANFSTSGELKFRTSYDGATWGGYTTMKAQEEYDLASNPYYVEFSTDGTHSVNLTSVQFSYTCEENPAAIGTTVSTDDEWVRVDSASDLSSGDEIVLAAVYSGSWYTMQNETISGRSYWLQTASISLTDSNSKATVTDSHSVWTVTTGTTSNTWKFQSNGVYLGSEVSGTYYNLALDETYSSSRDDWSLTFNNGNVSVVANGVNLYLKKYTQNNQNAFEYAGQNKSDSYTKYIFKKVAGQSGTTFDTPVDENGFTAIDTNKDNYNTNSIFDSANGLTVKATFTDGSTQTLTKGAAGYSYVVKNSSGNAIDTSKAFGIEDVYTLVVSYKKYIPVEITLNVGVYLEMQSITVSSDVLTYTTSDKLSDYLTGHVTARVTYNVSSYNQENIAYSNFDTYGLSLTLLNPSNVSYNTTNAFGTAGTWKIKVSSTENASVFGELEITVNAIMVQTITINGNESLTLQQTKTAQLEVLVNPSNATNKNVTWSTDDESVATVNATGLVTGVGVGNCTITAAAADGSGIYGTCAVTVTAYEGEANEGTFVLNTSGAPTIGSYVIIASDFEDGSTYAMSKTQNTNNRSGISTTISNSTIERDSDSEFAAFLVVEGSVSNTIAFYDEDNDGYLYAASSSSNQLKTESTLTANSSFAVSGSEAKSIVAQGSNTRNRIQWNKTASIFSCYSNGQSSVYIFEKGGEVIYPTAISISGETSIGVGETSAFTISYTPSNTTIKSITWSTSDDEVAGVSDGVVTGISAGSATITATAVSENGTIQATANVIVHNIAVTGVSLDKTTASISQNGTVALTPTISPSNATNKNLSWSTSDNSVATVNGGTVTGISAGTAIITVTTEDSNKTASCTVTVTSSGGSGGGASGSLTIEVSDMPASYTTNTFTKDSFGFYSTNIASGYTSGAMQWKNSAGELYNTTAIDGLIDITLAEISGKSFTATIYSGTSSSPSTNSESISSGSTYSFPNGVSYFRIKVGSGAQYCGDITINYSSEPVDPTAISVTPNNFELVAGKTKTLSVSYTPSSANQNKAVTWSSSDTNVATVDTSGIVTVKSTASVGQSATITAKLTNLPTIKATATVTVVDQGLADQTILIYMCGADLESDYASSNEGLATGDIEEILDVSNKPDDINIVIETGGAKKWSSTYGISASKLERWHVADGTIQRDASLTYASMGSSSTLQSFIEYGLNNYPANRTGLIFWNHGGAMQGVCYDEKSNDDSLLADEVITALSGAFTAVGRTENLEWVGYDACLMGVQDIAELNSHYFNYMVASEESESGYGWDYDTWVDDLYNYKTTPIMLKAIVDGFIASNGGVNSSSNDQTLAYYDLSYADEYLAAWEAMAAHLNITSSNKSSFANLVKNCKYYADDSYVHYGIFDAKDFINKLSSNSTFNPGSEYTSAVLSAHSNFVGYSSCGKGAGNSYGVAMFWAISYNCYKSTYYTSSMTNFSTWRNLVVTYGS